MTAFGELLRLARGLTAAILAAACCVGMFGILAKPAAGQSAKNPMDGLTATEYWAVYETIKGSGHLEADARFPLINLREPPKEEVLAWKPGMALRREALVVVLQGGHTFEAVVDVVGRKVISWKQIAGAQANLTGGEILGVDEGVKANAEFQAAMKKRGITDFATVICAGVSAGYYGTAEEHGRRIQAVTCYDRHGVWESFSRPIDGLTVIWDSDARKVLRVVDTGVVPVPQAPANFGAEEVGPLRDVPTPLSVDAAAGAEFQARGERSELAEMEFSFSD